MTLSSSRQPRDLLVLGGTGWLGATVARAALARGHRVTCLARGVSGDVPQGAVLVEADRWEPGAYEGVSGRRWDSVIEVSWQPALVRSALAALGRTASHWVYVSSVSVYPDDAASPSVTVEPWAGTGPVGQAEYPWAKVACEEACRESVAQDRLLVARAGLVAGYGDPTDRFGYWPARFAEVESEDEVVLVPPLDMPVQVIDVEDLAAWLVHVAEDRIVGTYDAVGDAFTFEAVVEECAALLGNEPLVAEVDDDWLVAEQVRPWSGPDSLPLWLPRPALPAPRDNQPAKRAGLVLRPLRDTVAAALAWEREQGEDRTRRAGLTAEREFELLTELIGEGAQ